MSYSSRIKKIINKCGSATKIYLDTGTVETIASIQPLRYKYRSYLDDEHVEVGVADKGKYLYIGPSDVRLDNFPDDTLIKNWSGEYVLKSAGKFCSKDEIVYIWGVLEAKREQIQ